MSIIMFNLITIFFFFFLRKHLRMTWRVEKSQIPFLHATRNVWHPQCFSGWLQVSTRNPKGRHRLWAMLPCTCPLRLAWYRRRWKSSVSQQIDKKSPKAGFAIQQLTGLKPNRANFQNILGRLAEKGRPDLIIEAFGEQIRNQSFALDHRDFTAGISTCGR